MSANAITDDVPYEIRCNPIVGRCLVAARDLEAGETVFREEAVAVGPLHETRPVCLECLQPLSGPVDSSACAGCSLPLCNKDECSKHRNYHSHRECELLQKASPFIDLLMMDPHPFYQCIMPLRCLLLKETDPDKWAAVKVMMDHVSLQSQEPYWEEVKQNVVRFILGLWSRCSQEEVFHVVGVLSVNAFEIKTELGYSGRGLYPVMALMSHRCIANVKSTFVARRGECRTLVGVKKGEELCNCYVEPLSEGTRWRRARLRSGWYFDCRCPRCEDPTEMGSHFSTLICPACPTGLLLPLSPLAAGAPSECAVCHHRMERADIDAAEEALESLVGQASPSALAAVLASCHPGHYLVVRLKRQLLVTGDMSAEERASIARDLLPTLDLLSPGLSRERGLCLAAIHSAGMGRIRGLLAAPMTTAVGVEALVSEVEACLSAGTEALRTVSEAWLIGSVRACGVVRARLLGCAPPPPFVAPAAFSS